MGQRHIGDSSPILWSVKSGEGQKVLAGKWVYLMWDRLQAHAVEVILMPGYSPNLNPAEWLWANRRGKKLANFCAQDITQGQDEARRGIKRIRSRCGDSSPEQGSLCRGDFDLYRKTQSWYLLYRCMCLNEAFDNIPTSLVCRGLDDRKSQAVAGEI